MELGPNQKKWVKALRSGRYNQTTDYLKVKLDGRGNGYCCLGVLCQINGKKWNKDDSSYFIFEIYSDTQDYVASSLPQSVVEEYKFYGRTGKFKNNNVLYIENENVKFCNINDLSIHEEIQFYESLADLNDNGYDFKFIADIIEQYPDQIFKESV